MKHSTVAIVGVSNIYREGLRGLLRRSKFLVVSNAATFDDLRPTLSSTAVDLVIFAVSRGEDPAVRIEQMRLCREAFPTVRIVLLTDRLTGEALRDAAAAGAQAVLSNEITTEVLQRALEFVMLGQQLFPGQPDEPPPPRGAATSLVPFTRPVSAPVQAVPPEPRNSNGGTTKAVVRPIFSEPDGPGRTMTLSERERQILHCLMDGAANKTIARQLEIREATVKVHIKGLLRKIRVRNRTQAAVWGLSHADVLDEPIDVDEPSDRPGLLVAHQVAS